MLHHFLGNFRTFWSVDLKFPSFSSRPSLLRGNQRSSDFNAIILHTHAQYNLTRAPHCSAWALWPHLMSTSRVAPRKKINQSFIITFCSHSLLRLSFADYRTRFIRKATIHWIGLPAAPNFSSSFSAANHNYVLGPINKIYYPKWTGILPISHTTFSSARNHPDGDIVTRVEPPETETLVAIQV